MTAFQTWWLGVSSQKSATRALDLSLANHLYTRKGGGRLETSAFICYISSDVHEAVVLHDIPVETISHDISVYLSAELLEIRNRHSTSYADTSLPDDWPGEEALQRLTNMAAPLFISATTFVRFISDDIEGPQQSLSHILENENTPDLSEMERTYLPVLLRLNMKASQPQAKKRRTLFQNVVGSINFFLSESTRSSVY